MRFSQKKLSQVTIVSKIATDPFSKVLLFIWVFSNTELRNAIIWYICFPIGFWRSVGTHGVTSAAQKCLNDLYKHINASLYSEKTNLSAYLSSFWKYKKAFPGSASHPKSVRLYFRLSVSYVNPLFYTLVTGFIGVVEILSPNPASRFISTVNNRKIGIILCLLGPATFLFLSHSIFFGHTVLLYSR